MPIRIATKRILCQSRQLVLCCYFPFHHPLFHPYSLLLCHVCLWCFEGSKLNVHVTSQDEATLCQVIVADTIHPANPYSPFPSQHSSEGDIKFLRDGTIISVKFWLFYRFFAPGKSAKFPQLLRQKTQELCCDSIHSGIASQLHSLISLFSLVRLSMSHCEDYSTHRKSVVPFTDQKIDTRDGMKGIQ